MSVSELVDALRHISIYTYHEDISQEIASLQQSRNRERQLYPYSITSTSDMAVNSLTAKASTHKCCNFKGKFDGDVKKIMDNIPSAVLDSHLRHMEEQSKKWR
jgi:hypothetical protein